MRVSCLDGHPDYDPTYASFSVYFDGKRRDDVVTADDEAGVITVYRPDPNRKGKFIIGPDGKFEFDTLKGKVEIRPWA